MMKTERLSLSVPTQDDYRRFYEIHSDPQTNLFNPEGPMDALKAKRSLSKNINHWKKHGFGPWIIRENDQDEIIGFGGLSFRLYGDEIKINLGYRFATSTWGKGFATELSFAAIDYGFSELNLEEIHAVVRPNHTVSIRVLEKCGLKLIGTLDDVACGPHSLVFSIRRSKRQEIL